MLARTFAARTAAEHAEQRMAFLADIGEILHSSLAVEETFDALLHLIVPELASCCVVEVLDATGRVRRAHVMHGDPDDEGARRASRRISTAAGALPFAARHRRGGCRAHGHRERRASALARRGRRAPRAPSRPAALVAHHPAAARARPRARRAHARARGRRGSLFRGRPLARAGARAARRVRARQRAAVRRGAPRGARARGRARRGVARPAHAAQRHRDVRHGAARRRVGRRGARPRDARDDPALRALGTAAHPGPAGRERDRRGRALARARRGGSARCSSRAPSSCTASWPPSARSSSSPSRWTGFP